MRRLIVMVALVAAVGACTPKAPAEDATKPETSTVAPPPPQLTGEAFKDCTWGEVKGGGVALNAYACPTLKLEGDEALPGIVVVGSGPEGQIYRSPVVQVFAKAADAPIEAVLAAVRAASPGGETCDLVPARQGWGATGRTRFELWPTGKDKDAYDAFIAGKTQDVIIPCGPLGPSEGGARTFEVLDGAPDKVVMLSWPSDIGSYDLESVRVAK